MHQIVSVLQTGIILTTPIFFVVTLVVLWRIVRATETSVAIALHVKHQIEVFGRGGLAGGVRPDERVQRAEERA